VSLFSASPNSLNQRPGHFSGPFAFVGGFMVTLNAAPAALFRIGKSVFELTEERPDWR
jgi:hypothetical protein